MGYVYVLTNPAMPGMVKIGKTENEVSARIGQLYSTGVPLPFDIAFVFQTDKMDEVEKSLHIAFKSNRVNSKREFFLLNQSKLLSF